MVWENRARLVGKGEKGHAIRSVWLGLPPVIWLKIVSVMVWRSGGRSLRYWLTGLPRV